MTGRALLLALLATGAVRADPAAACTIRPPNPSPEGRAEAAREARERQAALDRAVVFTAVVGKTGGLAVMDRPLRGVPPARIDLPRDTCSPFWQQGQRLVIYATRHEGRWSVVRTEPDTPAARAAVRRASKPR